MKQKKNDDGEEHSLTFCSREREKKNGARKKKAAQAPFMCGGVELVLFLC
jgi:hypothetical protein